MSSLIKGKFVYMKFKDYINKKTIRKLILKSILICVSVNDIRYTTLCILYNYMSYICIINLCKNSWKQKDYNVSGQQQLFLH